MYINNIWVSYTGNEESLLRTPAIDHIAKFRRRVITPFESFYSNECTVINYLFREDPTEGTSFSKPIKLGPYHGDFNETLAIDTRGAYFRDGDRLNYCGNDAHLELEITQAMYVDFITGSVPMNVWLDIWGSSEMRYNGISSGPLYELNLGAEYFDFPIVNDETMEAERVVSRYLIPGKYTIMLQGRKYYNSGCVNEVISINLRGTGPAPIQ